MNELTYVIGFSSSNLSLPIESQWLYAAGVCEITFNGLKAWYKQIRREDFEGPQAEKNLADLQWLAPRVIAHDTATSLLSEAGPFLPTKFGTLFSSTERLKCFVHQHQREISAFLNCLQTRREWGIKVFVDWKILQDNLKDCSTNSTTSSSGANYLKNKLEQKRAEASSKSLVTESLVELHKVLCSCYESVVRRDVPKNAMLLDPSINVRNDWVSSHAILSNREDDGAIIRTTIWDRWPNCAQYSDAIKQAIRIDVTGPWPAYSFAPSLQIAEHQAA